MSLFFVVVVLSKVTICVSSFYCEAVKGSVTGFRAAACNDVVDMKCKCDTMCARTPNGLNNVMIFDYKTKVTLWIYNSNKKQLICTVFLSSNP